MSNNVASAWCDYWKLFDELVESLKSDEKNLIINEFTNARKYVNGLTDGWYEFKFAFEKTLNLNKQLMTSDQVQRAEFLLSVLNNVLTNR